MPPPPVPFFSGRQVSASEADGLVAIRPKAGHVFEEPRGTSVLYLPTARLVSAEVRPHDEAGRSAVELRGDFNRVDRGARVLLAPLTDADAAALVRALAARYHLPRAPRPRPVYGLGAAPPTDLVAVVGTYAPGHFEAPNFEGVMLHCADGLQRELVAGQRYHVTGFVDPGAAPGSRVVGYSGATLRALAVQRDHFETPCPLCDLHVPRGPRERTTPAFTLRSQLAAGEQGFRDLDFLRCDAADAATFALLMGTGGQKTGDLAADLARTVLAALLGESAYGPVPHVPSAPRGSPVLDLAPWAGFLVDRSPLPAADAERLPALGARIGGVLRALNEKGMALSVGGVLASLRGLRLTLLRRGLARVYRVRGPAATLLVHEHSLAREYAAAGQSAPDELPQIPMSSFELPSDEAVHDFELAPGDLVVLVSEAALQLDDAAILELLAARRLAELAEGLAARERGGALVTLEIPGVAPRPASG